MSESLLLARRAVRAARRGASALARRTAERVPAGVGPQVLRRRVERARLEAAQRAVRSGDRPTAERLVAPLLRSPDVVLRARALEVTGDRDGALQALRAGAGTADDVAAALLQVRLLGGQAGSAERADVLTRLVRYSPAVRAVEVVDALAEHGDPDLAAAYRPVLAAAGPGRALTALDDRLAIWRLAAAHGQGPQALAAATREVPPARRAPLVARALAEVGAWEALAEAVDGAGLAAAETARWAGRALRAGHTSSAVAIARVALAADPAHRGADAVLRNGQDQLDVVDRRWQPVPVVVTPYEPGEHAVLSVLSQSLPIRSGGYATRTHGVLTGLAARGWQIEAVTRLGFPYDRWPAADPRTVADHDDVDGIRYHRLLQDGVRTYPQFPLSDYVRTMADGVERVARAHRARLVHASSFYVTGLAAASAARRLGLPFLYEMRGLEDLMKGVRDPDFASTDRYRFLDHVETEVCHEADAVFVITEALRAEMVRRGVAPDKLVVLPNGVHTEQFAPRERDRALEQQLGLQGVPVIGYAGSLVDYEGLELLMTAAAALRDRGVVFRVVVVGDGPAQAAIQASAEARGLSDLVLFTGRVPHDEVSRYLSLFDITPFPRLPLPVCELISPMKPFEALAMGKAVVVSSVAALTEIVQDGVTGLVFAKGDAADLARVLEIALGSPDLRGRLGEAGLAWVRAERDWSHVTATADATYREVLERRAASGG